MILFFLSGCVTSLKEEDEADASGEKAEEMEEDNEEESEEEVRNLRKRKRKKLAFCFPLSLLVLSIYLIATLIPIN